MGEILMKLFLLLVVLWVSGSSFYDGFKGDIAFPVFLLSLLCFMFFMWGVGFGVRNILTLFG